MLIPMENIRRTNEGTVACNLTAIQTYVIMCYIVSIKKISII